ncbi:hypothetical protein ABIA35_002412 [Catenulispora sp. MAP12-49]|uniref:LodA/GoxA family CTQ-dependent oxidase n=1 Tax=Catenulispora sp. MAP12-49 TaxID=3156302 RepID=UPI003517F2A0
MDAQQIVQVKIHPAIGIARVGNSPRPPFIGPESPDEPPLDMSEYKDEEGRIVRQAARFRLYGYDAAGKVVRELTLGDQEVSKIEWTVHVANKKAAWYKFFIPLDIPEADKLSTDQRSLRNQRETARGRLVIDPKARTLQIAKGGGEQKAEFDGGTIMGVPVDLGAMSVGTDGRLLVSGGAGKSAAWDKVEPPITGVANNDGWYDDTSDGPVTASVWFDGKKVDATPAWVVVGPPHYAPGVKTVRTLYDVLEDVFATEGTQPMPAMVTYDGDIEPILARFCQLQWTNRGFAAEFGWRGPHDFEDPAMRRRLRDPGEVSAELRRQVYINMRSFDRDEESPVPWPWMYGDAMTAGKATSVRQHIMLSAVQDRKLAEWAMGHFTPGDGPVRYPDVDKAPPAVQPDLLDRGALENCAAEAFHPGCEVTWPVRHASMYSEPFRILHREGPEPDYGPVLTEKELSRKDGPLYAQGPGDLTRWMAAPWQCDTASCRSGYQVVSGLGPRYSPYLPTFWPAQMPNQVLKESDFAVVNDTAKPDEERERAFEHRAVWLRGLTGSDMNGQRRQMIRDWYLFGIVHVRKYAGKDGKFPEYLQVESVPGGDLGEQPDYANLINIQVPQAGAPMMAAVAGTWTGEVPADQVEAGLVTNAVQEAMRATGYDEAAITAGYLEKLDPFHEAL